jgi:2-succinyl-6-hydroxy-2,4-cyclohexadiene-1-carboxylate synthase
MTVHHVPTPDGTTLATEYLTGSSKELIVYLHGFTGRGDDWSAVATGLRSSHSQLMVDIVGHGASDQPDRIEPYEMASVVDQILSLLSNRDVGTVHLVGYSMGGRVALAMAARAPWFFASVALISSSPGIADPKARELRRNADEALADRIESIGVSAFIDEWFEVSLFESLVNRLGPERISDEKAKRSNVGATGLANSLRGTGTGAMAPLWQALTAIRSPVLCINGSLDTKFDRIAAEMTSVLPDASHRRIAGAGHSLLLEAPEEVAEALVTFHDATSGRMTP